MAHPGLHDTAAPLPFVSFAALGGSVAVPIGQRPSRSLLAGNPHTFTTVYLMIFCAVSPPGPTKPISGGDAGGQILTDHAHGFALRDRFAETKPLALRAAAIAEYRDQCITLDALGSHRQA